MTTAEKPRFAAAVLAAGLLTALASLTACQTTPTDERDPDRPPPAPVTPLPGTQPAHGHVTTAPLPGADPGAPLTALAPAATASPGVGAAPVRTLRQAQQRLAELGYHPGPADGAAGPRTASALRAFQKDRGLPESGRLDNATRRALSHHQP